MNSILVRFGQYWDRKLGYLVWSCRRWKHHHLWPKNIITAGSDWIQSSVRYVKAKFFTLLDEESFKNCSDEIFGDSEITKNVLAEHYATFNRRYPHRYNEILEHEKDLQLSKRSRKRYILKLHPHVFLPPPPLEIDLLEILSIWNSGTVEYDITSFTWAVGIQPPSSRAHYQSSQRLCLPS